MRHADHRSARWHVLLALALAVLAGCATLPTDYPRSTSVAMQDHESTPIGKHVADIAAQHPGDSAFRIIRYGRPAFTARIALADLAAISERRTFRLLSPSLNEGLPAFLTLEAGRASGYMVAQYTAAALVGELRALAHPVSVDSIPTSDNQEDHVSMGMTAALLALESAERAETVVAIEVLCAAQALETGTRRPGRGTARLYAVVRDRVPALEEDRPPAPDIAAVRQLIAEGTFAAVVAEALTAEPAQ